MTPNQVRARITKREKRCDGDYAKVYGKCPGWRVVENAQRCTARVVACEECNALAPARLRVDDKMVNLLSEARDVANRRAYELQRAKRARATTTHLREDPATMTSLCGRRPERTKRRVHGWTYNIVDVTCAECQRLGLMTPAQRDVERGEKSALLRAKFADKNADKKRKRDEERAAKRAEIEAARPDAMVCLDLLERDGANFLAWTAEAFEMLSRCLALAVDARVIEKPGTRGKGRLWTTRSYREERVGLVQVRCRFCDVALDDDRGMGSVKEHEFQDHTIPCALRHLAGELAPKTRESDEVSPASDTVSGAPQDETSEAAQVPGPDGEEPGTPGA